MKTMTALPGQTLVKTNLFGSLALYRDDEKHTYALRVNGVRLATVVATTLLIVYVLGVSAGYFWLRNVRKIDQVALSDVALFRIGNLHHEMAVQQFAKAQASLAAGKYSEAYVEMSSGLHHDPDNVRGRLQLAHFLQLSGVTPRAVSTLEDGLNRTPDNRTLITATLDLLMTTGRGDRALELLHGLLAPQFSGPNGTLLRTDEVLATLSAEGPAAAQKVLAGYPDLKTTTDALPVVAEVLWASQSRQAAIETLAAYIRAKPDNLIAYLSLAGYQQKAGLIGEARQTAEAACARFPNDVATRLLRIDVFEPTRASEVSSWEKDIGSYVKDFGNRREALTELAELSGQKGWVDPARLLYEAAVGRQQDFRAEAMYYSDALMFHHSYQQALRILAEIDRQTPETASSFSVLLWQREIVAAAACGDHDDARESARRVASALRRDPEGLESIRQRFIRMGIPEAVAELTVTSPDLKAAAPKKS